MSRLFTLAGAVALVCSVPAFAGPREVANEKIVTGFIAEMDRMVLAGDMSDVPRVTEKYWTEDAVQHKPGMVPGRAALIRSLLDMKPQSPAERAKGLPFHTLFVISAEDRVTMVRRRAGPDPARPGKMLERYVFNVFRIENGKIAENWWSLSS